MKLTKGDIVLFQGDSITDGNRGGARIRTIFLATAMPVWFRLDSARIMLQKNQYLSIGA